MPRSKKLERYRIDPFDNPSGEQVWRVNGTRPNGKRVRENHKTRVQAAERRAELESEDEDLEPASKLRKTTLDEYQLADATTALGTLGKERSLTSIVEEYRKLERLAWKHEVEVADILRYFDIHYRPEAEIISIYNAREQFLKTRDGLSESTIKAYEAHTKKLLYPDPNMPVHKFTARDIQRIIERYENLNSRKSCKRHLSAFFAWAVRQEHRKENPCERLETINTDSTDIVTLTADEVGKFFVVAKELYADELIPCLAISLFAGLRPSEIGELEPKHILSDRIRVRGIGKMRRSINRAVPIPAVLDAWLTDYPFNGQPDYWYPHIKIVKEIVRPEMWGHDIFRHTSISYQYERDQNIANVARDNGTSSDMINRHYLNIKDDPHEVQRFWNLTPETVFDTDYDIEYPESRKPTDWPSDQALAKLVYEKPLTHIAKELGVSDNAVRKHCLTRGINLPKNGYWQRKRSKFSL